MSKSVFLITPPFTQLNTPYPATAYLKGFLNTKGISSFQADHGIETILRIFSSEGITKLFDSIDSENLQLSENSKKIISQKKNYIKTIDHVIRFLQGKDPVMANHISNRNFLPEASRFDQVELMDWAFGTMGIQDKAKFLCTMYLEDLSDLIKETTDEHFGFSRYAEKLGRSANTFDELYAALHKPYTFIDKIYLSILESQIDTHKPLLVAISVPFPGNLYTAFRTAQWIKEKNPGIKVAMGGGFANTELRSLKDQRVFEFFDFITLDDGELPIERIFSHIVNKNQIHTLKRTLLLHEGIVCFMDDKLCNDYKQSEIGTPDYDDLPLDKYISAMEIANPMHRLWSDGRWNKLTMAHGCYWGKCTFCDINLDYIKIYEPIAASLLCDRIEEMIHKTNQRGFHFVDEAAPPSLIKALALEIIKRGIVISWWTNVRFEKSFTRDLCILLRASGCIAVSGGLEVASNRLLKLINKGITVEQVARVNKYFTEAGIMVHAYLMYGFPTQTEQETIDSLEMVRQLFKSGVLKSGFWHQFTMTAHSPIGHDPEKFLVEKRNNNLITFADNDIEHIDPTGADHEKYSFGLKKSLFNYMQYNCINDPIAKWFDFKVPKTSIDPNYIEQLLSEEELVSDKPNAKLFFLGSVIGYSFYVKSKKGLQKEMITINFSYLAKSLDIQIPQKEGLWLLSTLEKISIDSSAALEFQDIRKSYESNDLEDFDLFWYNKPMSNMYKVGLITI